MIDTNAAIALKEPNKCDPLDVTPNFLLEGKKRAVSLLFYYRTIDLHPLLFDERIIFGVHRTKAQSQSHNLKFPTNPYPIINLFFSDLDDFLNSNESSSSGDLYPTPMAMDGVRVVPEVPLSESLFLTKKLDRSYLSSVLKPLKDLNTTTKRNDEETRFMIDPETLELEPVLVSEDETSITTSGATHKCDQWNERYSELLAYKSELGHCNVPYHWPSNPPLSQWVKRQRHQYKLKIKDQHSNLTNNREQV